MTKKIKRNLNELSGSLDGSVWYQNYYNAGNSLSCALIKTIPI